MTGAKAEVPVASPASEGKSGRSRNAEVPTYYDLPALKASIYGWKVSAYMAIGGVAGSAQIIAAAADLIDREGYRAVVRRGRYIALAGAAIGGPLLIIDLHTPQRFYNMLRIFRPTSPMSIGTYVLLSFGGLSAALAAAQLARDRGWSGTAAERTAAMVLDVPAAVAGAAMSTYTGALLGATSTPLWAAAPRLIPALFGASAMAGAAAALSLGARGAGAKALSRIELLASGVELCLLAALPARLRAAGIETASGIAPVLLTAALPMLHEVAKSIELPRGGQQATPAVEAAARRSAVFGEAAAVGVLAGAFLLRHLLLRAGNRSAERPRDYFRFAGRRPR